MQTAVYPSWFLTLGVLLILVLLLAGIAAFVIVAITRKNSSVLIWLAVPAVLTLTILPLFGLFVGTQSKVSGTPRVSEGEIAALASIVDVEAVTSAQRTAWDPNLAPVANLYPSVAACGRPMAKQVADVLKLKRTERTKFNVEIKHSIREREAVVVAGAFRKEFLVHFPGSEIKLLESGEADATDGSSQLLETISIDLTIETQDNRTVSWSVVALRTGKLVCRWARGANSTNSVEIAFSEKPWLENPEQFVSQHPNDGFAVHFSKRLGGSPNEATQSVLDEVNTRLRKERNSYFGSSQAMEANVLDRFVQRLSMPYGDVWQEAVLLDLGRPKQLLSFGPNYTDSQVPIAAARRSRSRTSPEFLIASLAFLVVSVGWVSNLLTQGYYRQKVNSFLIIGVGAFFGVLVCIVLFRAFAQLL